MKRYFVVPLEQYVETVGPMAGRTGHRPKYKGEIGFHQDGEGMMPDKSLALIRIEVPEHATDEQCNRLSSMPDVEEVDEERAISLRREYLAKQAEVREEKVRRERLVGNAVKGAIRG